MSTRERSAADQTWEVDSPFLNSQEVVAVESEEEWEPRATALAEESPFQAFVEASEVLEETDELDSREAAYARTSEDEESETDERWETLQEDQLSSQASRPASNAVDADAAEPLFTDRVRSPEVPLLDAATLKVSSRWNEASHPGLSGITLVELRERLEKYLDRSALDDLLRRANVGATSPIGSDDATVVTLLAHHFQRKTCRTPTVGDIHKLCTVNGRVAEDTLDALGFVYHAKKSLNTADRPNRVAAAILRRVPASSFAGEEPGLTARTWWSYMVSPPWLGLPIKQGIHIVLLKRLRRAQRALMSLPAYAGLSPVELGLALGLEEEHKGARPDNVDLSMHLFGLGIDVSYTRNPWVSNPKQDTARLAAITLRAARLVGPSGSNQGITAAFLHGLATTHRDTAKIHKILAEWSRWLSEYFALAGNGTRLEGLLPIANAIYPDGAWFKRGESLSAAAVRWAGMIRTDFDGFAKAVSRGGRKDEVRHGFMDLPRDLVIALRDDACLGWGAVDFGRTVSGDIMHFDCRVDGLGRIIATTADKPFVPTSGHPCIPAGAPAVQHELEQPDEPAVSRANPPRNVAGGQWFAFTSDAIPRYTDTKGKLRLTSCSVYLPDPASKEKTIDLLVFFHGDPDADPCVKMFDPDPNDVKKFGLDAQINSTRRKVALAVPFIHWIRNQSDNVRGKWTAANLNGFVTEVLNRIGHETGVRPKLRRLVLAGHSHAFDILTPLAREFHQGAPATTKGPLASLDEVWALDSTYGQGHVRALDAWASARPNGRFIAVLYKKGSRWAHWNGYYKQSSFGFGPPPNLRMCAVDDGKATHCIIPSKYIARLLSIPRNDPNWCGLLV